MIKNKEQKISPIKTKPLRMPGQSLEEQIRKINDDKITPYIAYSACLLAITFLEWYYWLLKTPRSPFLTTLIALIVITFCFRKILKQSKQVRLLKLAREGEIAVGQELELLREKGYIIYHDLLGENFNIDHAIISERGIFVIETKTLSKPVKGNAQITFDGKEISIDGYKTTKPITQAKAEASWVRKIIKESTGKSVSVKPIVVYPGWYIKITKSNTNEVWVLNPKAVKDYIENTPATLPKEDMMLISYHISMYIRANYK